MKFKNQDRDIARKNVFFVDPMSYNNLAIYDYSLISNIEGYNIDFFCNKKYDYKKFDKSNIRPIFNYTEKKGFLKIFSFLLSQFVLLYRIFVDDVSIVHFQWFKIPSIDYFFLRIFKKKVKIIFTAHNVLPHNTGNTYLKVYKKIYELCDSIIVHSSTTKLELSVKFRIPAENIHVIPHGTLDLWYNINTDKVDEFESQLRQELKLDGKLVFGALGTINNYKGIDFIVDAWKQNNLRTNDEIKLLIAGNGKHQKLTELESIENAIVINRYLSNEEFLALLKVTDFLLLPYKQISQSGILLTALNEKKRVIVSNVGGLKDPFDIGDIGYVMKNLNAVELNKLISKAIDQQDKVPSAAVWNQILSYYDWSEIGIKTSKLYSKCGS